MSSFVKHMQPQQPAKAASTQWSNLWVPNARGVVDVVNGTVGYPYASGSLVTNSVGLLGRGVKGPTGAASVTSAPLGVAMPVKGSFTGATSITVFAVMVWHSLTISTTAERFIIRRDQDGTPGNSTFALDYFAPGTNVVKFRPLVNTDGTSGWTVMNDISFVAPAIGVPYLVGFTWKSGGYPTVFFGPIGGVNGYGIVGSGLVKNTATGVAPTGGLKSITANGDGVCQTHIMGTAYFDGTSSLAPAEATFFMGGISTKAVSDNTLKQLAANPWSVFKTNISSSPALRQNAFLLGGSGVTGTASSTLSAATSSATGTVTVSGTAASTLAAATSTATGVVTVTGVAATTLSNATSSATGTLTVTGTASSTLAAATSAITGTVTVTGTSSTTLAAATTSVTGVIGSAVSGIVSSTLGAATSAITGSLKVSGTASSTLGAATATITGTVYVNVTGSAASTLAPATSVVLGTVKVTGSAASTLSPATTTVTGQVAVIGAASSTLANLTATLTGNLTVSGTASSTLGALISAAVGALTVTGTASSTLAPATISITGGIFGANPTSLTITVAWSEWQTVGSVLMLVPRTQTLTVALEHSATLQVVTS